MRFTYHNCNKKPRGVTQRLQVLYGLAVFVLIQSAAFPISIQETTWTTPEEVQVELPGAPKLDSGIFHDTGIKTPAAATKLSPDNDQETTWTTPEEVQVDLPGAPKLNSGIFRDTGIKTPAAATKLSPDNDQEIALESEVMLYIATFIDRHMSTTLSWCKDPEYMEMEPPIAAEVKLKATDMSKAHNYLEATAAGGDSKAMFNLAVSFEEGIGGAPDFEKAASWYEKAALKGNDKACLNLGIFYVRG